MTGLNEAFRIKYGTMKQRADADEMQARAQANLLYEQANWHGPNAQSEISLRNSQAGLNNLLGEAMKPRPKPVSFSSVGGDGASAGIQRNGNTFTSAPTTPTPTSTPTSVITPGAAPTSLQSLSEEPLQSVFDVTTANTLRDDMLGLRQQFRKGSSYVRDKTGKGSPKKDTVPAMLAHGEAVLNAGAAQILGRDQIEQLNKQGLRAMGAPGKSQAVVKDGKLHAAVGVIDPEKIYGLGTAAEQEQAQHRAFYDNARREASAKEAFSKAGWSSASDSPKEDFNKWSSERSGARNTAHGVKTPSPRVSTPPELPSLKSVGGALNTAATIGMYAAAPDESKVAAASALNPILGGAMAASAPIRRQVEQDAKDWVSSKWRASHPKPEAKTEPKAAKQESAAVTSQPETVIGKVDMSKINDPKMYDEVALSNFFGSRGITKKMRDAADAAPFAEPGRSDDKSLRRVDVGPGSRVYRRGNEFIGMGLPSRIAAEEAAAKAAQPAQQLEEMRQAAMMGNKLAADMYTSAMAQAGYDKQRDMELQKAELINGLRTSADAQKRAEKTADDMAKVGKGMYYGVDKNDKTFEDERAGSEHNALFRKMVEAHGIPADKALYDTGTRNRLDQLAKLYQLMNRYTSEDRGVLVDDVTAPTQFVKDMSVFGGPAGNYSFVDAINDKGGLRRGENGSIIPIEWLLEKGASASDIEAIIKGLRDSGRVVESN